MSKIEKILTLKDKGVSRATGTNGVLARLLRQIFYDLGVNPMRWGALMTAFIQDRRNGVPDNKKDQASMRANLTKEFARPDITWKVFCKGLKFMQIVRIHFIIEAEHANGRKTQHSTNVYFGGRDNVRDIVDELEQEDDPDAEYGDDPRLPQLNTKPQRSEDSHG